MNPITSIGSLSGDLLIVVIAGLVFVEETGIPIPFAPGDLLLIIAGIQFALLVLRPLTAHRPHPSHEEESIGKESEAETAHTR